VGARCPPEADAPTLKIDSKSYALKEFNGVYAVGFGKASAPMAQALEEILGEWLKGGIVVVKEGHALPLKKIKILESGHPVPDRRSLEAAVTLLDWANTEVQRLNPPEPALERSEGAERVQGAGPLPIKRDLVFCLVTGGGSALLCAPPGDISLEEVKTATALLLASGAEIKEMNTVRKHLSLIHGGRLARALYPATVINLVVSDVVGDVLDMVSSGPTLPDPSTYKGALEIVYKYGLAKRLPERVYEYLKRGVSGEVEETPKEGDVCFRDVHTFLLGSNMRALEAAEEKAIELGYNTLILGSSFTGEAREVARVFSSRARECGKGDNPLYGPALVAEHQGYMLNLVAEHQGHSVVRLRRMPPMLNRPFAPLKGRSGSGPACLLAGGETTVTLRGNGRGGRNQEFALASAMEIEGLEGVVILSGGTDGNDGPTEAAGAVVDGTTCRRARELGMEPEDFLMRNDSHTFFCRLGDHIITGPTRTNVMDIMLCLTRGK
ncbi:MAG: glycerate kinase, partial [Candidatus Brocadiaceae bacterium]|nr:glycerate kinase [Candidatus Brocadiaceae bacterium]